MATAAVGCSDEDGGGASDVASEAASAASSLASKGSDVAASATAAAREKLDGFKDGVDAKGDVVLGDVSRDADGRSTVKVTVVNGSGSAMSYAVQINFRDKDDNLLDTVVVSVDDVQPDRKKDATARSNRTLDGDVTAQLGRALRH
ncbi:FxLYD domain-containing protein [Streptomyces sp. 24-1644]|uniref:FxLYD domain-containing protein n=1 Tax=Streptomyces sp. 24-1644 TaxID=3457315 RepID=UPI003FA758F1